MPKENAMLDIEAIRREFPALKKKVKGNPLIYLDGPGGTQVPNRVIRAIGNYYRRSNANTHGAFATARETDQKIDMMRSHLSTLLNAEGAHCISVGQNMTSLNFALARAFGRFFQPGDEVLITQLDHEANRGPWLSLREKGILVKEVKLLPSGVLDYDDLAEKLSDRTRLVAMGMSSNAIGTVNDVQKVRQLTYAAGAWLLLDAVHYAPHFSIDVQAIGCDFLLCSAYKFYGPHVGILYAKTGLIDQLPTDRLRTTDQMAPYSIETGTLNHAALAGVIGAVDFLANLGEGDTQRTRLVDAFDKIHAHEHALASKLYTELSKISGIDIIGQDFSDKMRTPTVSFTLKGKRPEAICQQLAAHNICAWDGHFYAIRAMEVLGLAEIGGVTRLGISVYTTEAEIDQTIAAIKSIAGA